MKPTPILLPPEIEPYVRRLSIGSRQPEYTVIPAIQVTTPNGGPLVGLISRWELDASERNALARTELRGMIHAFANWLGTQVEENPALRGILSDPVEIDVTMAELARKFIGAHASQLDGEDAALWYTRLALPSDAYQPQMMEVATAPPIDIIVEPTPGVILPSSPGVVH